MKTLLGVVAGLVILSNSAFAAQETGPCGLPLPAKLKETCALDDEQVAKITKIYEEYKAKSDEVMKKVKDAQDKKAAGQEVRTLRTEIAAKVEECGKDEEQKKKIKDACAQQRKKKTNNQ